MEDLPNFTQKLEPAKQSMSNVDAGQRVVFPVIEEQLKVSKKIVELGIVRVSKTVHDEEVNVEVPIVSEEIDVQRVALNQYVESPPGVRYEGDTMIVPVLREVVEKRLVLVEELHITKRRVQTQDSKLVNLRREEITVERIANDQTKSTPAS